MERNRVHDHGDLEDQKENTDISLSVYLGIFNNTTGDRKKRPTAPEKIPPLPTPEIARPMMKATELGAAPQMALPTSKSKMVVRRTPFTLYSVYSLPKLS